MDIPAISTEFATEDNMGKFEEMDGYGMLRYDSVGNLLVIHCSGGQNGVVVTGREGFAVAARPDLFTD